MKNLDDYMKLADSLRKAIKLVEFLPDIVESVPETAESIKETFESFPDKILSIITTSSLGAAASAAASSWIPGVGSAIATTISAGFIWSMYGSINIACGISLSENALKSLGSAIAMNLLSYFAGGMILTTAFSLLPGIGSIGASAVFASTCFALTFLSGILYIKLLTELLEAGINPQNLTDQELQEKASNLIEREDIKKELKTVKKLYRSNKKEREEIKSMLKRK